MLFKFDQAVGCRTTNDYHGSLMIPEQSVNCDIIDPVEYGAGWKFLYPTIPYSPHHIMMLTFNAYMTIKLLKHVEMIEEDYLMMLAMFRTLRSPADSVPSQVGGIL